MAVVHNPRRGRQKSLPEVLARLSKIKGAEAAKGCAEDMKSAGAAPLTKLHSLLMFPKCSSKGGSSAVPGAKTCPKVGENNGPVGAQHLKRKRILSLSSWNKKLLTSIPLDTGPSWDSSSAAADERQDSGSVVSWKKTCTSAAGQDDVGRDSSSSHSSVGSHQPKVGVLHTRHSSLSVSTGRSCLCNDNSDMPRKDSADTITSLAEHLPEGNANSIRVSTGASLGPSVDGPALQVSKPTCQEAFLHSEFFSTSGINKRWAKGCVDRSKTVAVSDAKESDDCAEGTGVTATCFPKARVFAGESSAGKTVIGLSHSGRTSEERTPAQCYNDTVKGRSKEKEVHRCCICGCIFLNEETYLRHWEEEIQGVLDDEEGEMQNRCNTAQTTGNDTYQGAATLDQCISAVEVGARNTVESDSAAGSKPSDPHGGAGGQCWKNSEDGSPQNGVPALPLSRFRASTWTGESHGQEPSGHRGAIIQCNGMPDDDVDHFRPLLSHRADKTPMQTRCATQSRSIPHAQTGKSVETAAGTTITDGVFEFLKVLADTAEVGCDKQIEQPARAAGRKVQDDNARSQEPPAARVHFRFLNPAAQKTEKLSSSRSILVIGDTPKARPAGVPFATETSGEPDRHAVDKSTFLWRDREVNATTRVSEEAPAGRSSVQWRRRGRRRGRKSGTWANKAASNQREVPNSISRRSVDGEHHDLFNHYADGGGFWDADQIGLDYADVGVGGMGGWECMGSVSFGHIW